MKIGSSYSETESEFTVWAPHQTNISLVLPEEKQILKMDNMEDGYWLAKTNGIKPNSRYLFRLADNIDRPDPASHFQPDGVFGSSAVVDHSRFNWKDNNWHGVKLEDLIIYELHIGTFSPEGTFAGVSSRAAELSKMGINAVELMPISQFSGARNWGYDVAYPFAVQNTYGGPEQLKKLVQEFHSCGIAIILDVVYNHLGPEGNFLNEFGPYFCFSRKTPWGASMNFDGQLSSHVRNFFFENAIHLFKNYHIDGLRLDAVFAIIDNSPKHFIKELSEKVDDCSKEIGRKLLLIAENDHVDPIMIKPRKAGGYGLNAVWHDNLHHSIHAILTGERNWYYSSFGTLSKVVEALSEGCSETHIPPSKQDIETCSSKQFSQSKLVVFSQNHDQIGNRPSGERLKTISGIDAAKLAAGIILLSPFTPLIFMGEEYGEDAPFLFFTDFSDETLGKKVKIGRKRELHKNGWKSQLTNSPQEPEVFIRSKIDWNQRSKEKNKLILNYYQKLISLREIYFNKVGERKSQTRFLEENKSVLMIQDKRRELVLSIVANFSNLEQSCQFPFNEGLYLKILDSSDIDWAGPGSTLPSKVTFNQKLVIKPQNFAVYLKSNGEK